MHIKWFLIGLAFISVHLGSTLASTKRKKNEEESKENSINYVHNDMRGPSMLSSLLHDATLPVFLVMGLASLASVLTSNGKNEVSGNGIHGRNKRSPTSGWTANILKILGNVQKAVEKYQVLEDEILNDLDEGVAREFPNKSSD